MAHDFPHAVNFVLNREAAFVEVEVYSGVRHEDSLNDFVVLSMVFVFYFLFYCKSLSVNELRTRRGREAISRLYSTTYVMSDITYNYRHICIIYKTKTPPPVRVTGQTMCR